VTKKQRTPQQVRRREAVAEWAAISRAIREEQPDCAALMTDAFMDEEQAKRWMNCTWRTTEAHHVLPRARGGPHERWNALGLCHNCHQFIHSHPLLAQGAGWLAKVGASCPLP